MRTDLNVKIAKSTLFVVTSWSMKQRLQDVLRELASQITLPRR